jgi:prepilin-type N-terminal cleavage/methylation domain-containing protein
VRAARRLSGRLRRDERGFTLVEMLTVLAMLGLVIAALTTILVAAMNAEREMNRRFASQINARLALDQLRREVHCASSVTPTGASSSVTIVLGSRCPSATGGTTVTWCTSGSGARFALYRVVGTTCSTSGKRAADFLTSGTVFVFTPQSPTSLAVLSVTLPVNTRPESGMADYRLEDDIVLRNSTRA